MIPYTAGLQRAFNRALHPWLFDLFSHFGSLWGGPAYWVVSPRSAEKRVTTGGVPIGFAADSDYFGAWAKPLITLVTVVPEEAAGLSNPAVWKYVTLLCLLRQSQMRLISLWNPTLFTALLSQCGEWAASLAGDLENGTCCPAFFRIWVERPGTAALFWQTFALDAANGLSTRSGCLSVATVPVLPVCSGRNWH